MLNPRFPSPRTVGAGLAIFGAALLGNTLARAQNPSGVQRPPQEQARGGRRQSRVEDFRTAVPPHPADIILGRPTKHAITCSVLSYEDTQAYIEYGKTRGVYSAKTPLRDLRGGEPFEFRLSSLEPSTRYYYRMNTRSADKSGFEAGPEYSFVTARSPGEQFTFVIQADSHLDSGSDPDTYRRSLGNALAARPDFLVDLGDTFMTDKYPEFRQAAPQYLAQRYYLGLLGHSAPIFLTLGNHDGEDPTRGTGPDSMAIWSNKMRKRYFPNPVPDDFYSGNGATVPSTGQLQNYFAWTWGDALLVVLDPFWYSQRPRGRSDVVDNWGRTLGTEQYEWLKRTLEGSRARFKFVFIHHLVGGETREGRGGSEASQFFEWGGKDLDGTQAFARKRPGWSRPIHDLLVQHGVSVVFHGHDHLYVRQERDGIIYQEVPQPSHSRVDNTRSAEDYGYRSGVVQGSSGILRVSVSPEKALVEYVRAYPPGAEGDGRKTGTVTHSYTVPPS